MSVRTDIQKKIIETVKAGTFNAVSYDSSDLPIEGAAKVPSSVICNEVTGGITNTASRGASSLNYSISNWRFEVLAEFNCEVDTSYFLLNELKNINVSSDGVLITITPGDFSTEHPPRNASHNGTKLRIGLTANIRR